MDSERARTNAFPGRLLAVQAAVRREPHVVPLNDWVAAESDSRRLRIPWFDPGDAGVGARVLFLQAAPGPTADATRGSGIVSVDNDDPTAAALWSLRRDAGLAGGCLLWNAVPWFVRGELTPGDERRAEPLLRRLLLLLPDLEVVVPMGRVAQRMWATYTLQRQHGLATLPTWLPTRRALADPERRDAVALAVRRAAVLVGAEPPGRRGVPDPLPDPLTDPLTDPLPDPSPDPPATASAPATSSAPAGDAPATGAPADEPADPTTGFPRLREAIAKIADRALPS